MTEMLNLVPAIREIENKINDMEYEFKQKIKPYKDSLYQLRQLNQACECCNGNGKVLRSRACAEDDRPDPNDSNDWNICQSCLGSGLSKSMERVERKLNGV